MNDEKDIFNNNGDTGKEEFGNDDIFSRLNDNSEMEDADDDLLALLDMISAQDEMQKSGSSDYTPKETPNKPQQEEVQEAPIFSLDDFNLETGDLDMVSMDSFQSEQEEEIADSFEADKILTVNNPKSEGKEKSLDNMGDVFSDALSAMDRLEDEEGPVTEAVQKEKKLGFFQRLFGGVGKKDKSEVKEDTKLSKDEKKKAKAKEKLEAKKKATQEKAKAAKVQAKKPEPEPLTAQEIAKIEKAKEGKAKKAAAKADKKKTADAKKIEKKKAATDKAAIKAEKKKANAELNPPDPEDNIKLNPIGIVFIMTFFILIAGVVIIGTNTYSYKLGMENASIDYSRGRYMEAYNSIYGLNVKEKDAKTYDKIITTMYVYKQLNSYYNYTELKKQPEALDSLLKGLNRYDTHIEHAKELGIDKNLNSIKELILKELKQNYGMTEKQAKSLNAITDHTQYSLEVINIASDKE